jgi:G3E family GTPase
MTTHSRIILVGGFLGAGKTTLLLSAARRLTEQGHRVGIVANDQGQGLVDTALVAHQGTAVSEVAAGCFCCRYPDLMQSLVELQNAVQPDVILAEPVGSCTDLMATVIRPLKRDHAGRFALAPLTVVFDPARDLKSFPDNVRYLHQRQLAEAEVIALNKVDLLNEEVAGTLDALRQQYPSARIAALSARTGEGMADWLNIVMETVTRSNVTLDLDYERYAKAEACLAWLNAKGALTASQSFSPRDFTEALLMQLNADVLRAGGSIAHIKLYVHAPTASWKASLPRSGGPISWDVQSPAAQTTQNATFILNARVNTQPAALAGVVRASFADMAAQGVSHAFTHWECFEPLPPKPTYRLAASPALR